jgi:hypothetical protein
VSRRRLPRNEEKELEDANRLYRLWRVWHREQFEAALAGAHGALLAELVVVLDQLEINSSARLLALMERADWDSVPADVRFEALHLINTRIGKMRERYGLPAIDDPLPSQPDNVFHHIKRRLFSFPSQRESPAGAFPAKRETGET